MSSENTKNTLENKELENSQQNLLDENKTKDCDSDDDSDLDEPSTEDFLQNLVIQPGSEKYVVTQNNEPLFYAETLEEAKKFMWEIARQHKMKFFDSNVFIYEGISENHITLSHKHKFFLIPYEQVLCNLHISPVFKLVPKDLIKEQDEKQSNISKEQSSWQLFSS